jgi:hypothetical protein
VKAARRNFSMKVASQLLNYASRVKKRCNFKAFGVLECQKEL